MHLLTFCILINCVYAQFDIIAKYPILANFDQIKCLRGFTPKNVRDGIRKISDYLTVIEEYKMTGPTNDFYLLNTDIDTQHEFLQGKQPYVLNAKLSDFPTKCKDLQGVLPAPVSESGVSKLKSWLDLIGVAANTVLPKVAGNFIS